MQRKSSAGVSIPSSQEPEVDTAAVRDILLTAPGPVLAWGGDSTSRECRAGARRAWQPNLSSWEDPEATAALQMGWGDLCSARLPPASLHTGRGPSSLTLQNRGHKAGTSAEMETLMLPLVKLLRFSSPHSFALILILQK